MARIRTIKPDFWTDEKIVELSFEARLFFIGSWNFADDNGNLQRSAKKLKMQIFPADALDCEPLIQSLMAHGLLSEYEVNGEKYLHIKGFTAHQVINRPSKTGLPVPVSGSTPTPLTDDSLTEGKGREGKGKEVNQSHSDGGGKPGASDSESAESPPVSGAKYSTLLIRWERERKKLIRCNPAEQTFVDWLNLGLAEEQLRLAYEMAVARREADNDPSPLNVGLVNSCVQQVLNPPTPKPQREDTTWKRTNPGIERKASELGIYARAGESHDALRERCESEIRKRTQGVAA